jgi:undecaprenyl phosphate N,N'-diacetylbacillosamine 1-phosphate transferase
MYSKILKRPLDVMLSMVAIVILSPLMLVVWIALLHVNNGNVLFRQPRVGKDERIFLIIKFRSMNNKTNREGKLLSDVQRLTPMGKFIRAASIDELPQLFNVIKGEMSIIGPRPLPAKYLPLYSEQQRDRHRIRPGITGLAQVNGRNSISWARKFEFDCYYVSNISFLLDLKILFLTMKKVFKREGINQSNERPMEPFNGSN